MIETIKLAYGGKLPTVVTKLQDDRGLEKIFYEVTILPEHLDDPGLVATIPVSCEVPLMSYALFVDTKSLLATDAEKKRAVLVYKFRAIDLFVQLFARFEQQSETTRRYLKDRFGVYVDALRTEAKKRFQYV